MHDQPLSYAASKVSEEETLSGESDSGMSGNTHGEHSVYKLLSEEIRCMNRFGTLGFGMETCATENSPSEKSSRKSEGNTYSIWNSRTKLRCRNWLSTHY